MEFEFERPDYCERRSGVYDFAEVLRPGEVALIEQIREIQRGE